MLADKARSRHGVCAHDVNCSHLIGLHTRICVGYVEDSHSRESCLLPSLIYIPFMPLVSLKPISRSRDPPDPQPDHSKCLLSQSIAFIACTKRNNDYPTKVITLDHALHLTAHAQAFR